MAISSSGCAAVDAMSKIAIKGNVTPPNWYKVIKKENGRPDLLAAAILSDIVYWYRPVEVRDEATGYVIGLQKKFKADLLQKTYESYSNMYGEKKRIVKESMDRLEKLGLIKKIFRDIVLESGFKIPNVMYIEVFPERIAEISEEEIDPSKTTAKSSQTAPVADPTEGITVQRTTPCEDTYDPLRNNGGYLAKRTTYVSRNDGGHPTVDLGTNTENTSEATTKNTTEITTQREYSPVLSAQDVDNSDDDELEQVNYSKPIKIRMEQPEDRRTDRDIYIEFLRDQVQYDRIRQEDTYGDKMNIVDGIINIIADIATTDPPDGYERVNGRQYPHEVVKSRLLKMDYETITHVLERFKENKTEIRNMRSYLLTALYNARDEKDIQFQNFFNHSYYGTDWTSQRRED